MEAPTTRCGLRRSPSGAPGASQLQERRKATSFNCYAHPILKREVCGGDFETVIQRSQWGVNDGVPDNVKLVVQVEAVKQ